MARLPPLDSLHVFAVAARHLSFTKAAAELHRTQSAVSHRVKALEAEIGLLLFHRTTRRLELTDAGRALARQIDQSLSEIARTLAKLDRREARRLTVTLLPSVASRWLMPRLPRFCDQNPDIDVRVIADARVLDLRAEGVDAAVRFGLGQYTGYAVTPLMPDRVLPVCSASFAKARGAITTIDALLEWPLLHDSTTEGDGSQSDWRSWLDALSRSDATCDSGQRFSDAGLLIEATLHGLGVALARHSLVADYLANGALVCPLSLITPTAFAYYLVVRPEATALAKIVRFRDWLKLEATQTAAAANHQGSPSAPGRLHQPRS
jgi:LysR family transcriptional regulator, glycine cleavage system transcriptional activator